MNKIQQRSIQKKPRTYREYEEDRERYTKAVLESDANRRKIIIAGPGTGKSYLFEKVCERRIKQGKTGILTLSFINELIDDLSLKLHGRSDVQTLHSFALGNLGDTTKYFLNLEDVLNQDFKIIHGKDIDFASLLCNLTAKKNQVSFYFDRQRYYGHHSPISSVYQLTNVFKSDPNQIPTYSQVLIDEYQDFNKLESDLIDLLAQKNPILIVGDDDQSLYGWKHADPELIRMKRNSSSYRPFDLPYCSRCTRVIVKAFWNIVDRASQQGFLSKRHKKLFEYFPSEEKDKLSKHYQRISVRKKVYKNKIGYYIDQAIRNNIDPRKIEVANTSVLIITPFTKHVNHLEKVLRKKGYKNITVRATPSRNQIIEGFNLLLKDSTCNLGWRLISEKILKPDAFKRVLKRSYENRDGQFCELIDTQTRKDVQSIRATLEKVRNGRPVEKGKLERVFKYLGHDLADVMLGAVKQDVDVETVKKNVYKNVPIKITTIQGSKGLDANFVFLVNFDERYVMENGVVTDESLYKFLVSLTRASDKLFIYSSENKLPAFVKWLEGGVYKLEDPT